MAAKSAFVFVCQEKNLKIFITPSVNKSLCKKPKPQPSAVPPPGTTNLQAVAACSTGQAATVQPGTACEARDAEAEGVLENVRQHGRNL